LAVFSIEGNAMRWLHRKSNDTGYLFLSAQNSAFKVDLSRIRAGYRSVNYPVEVKELNQIP